jgi:3alpha(or 20beta)-hydroxysteroid dehydrogenase
MAQRLEGKVALVTGASQGQGAAHTEVLAREGAHVVATDVLDEQGQALADRLNAEGLNVVYRHLDVASSDDWSAAIETVDPTWGAVSILVNNAGIASPTAVDDVERAEWDRVVAINQTGIMLGIQAVLPGMKAHGGGSIVNTASSWAHNGGTENGAFAYVTTKAAVLGLTRNAAMNLARHGIRVNSVSPGYVRTAQIEFAEKNEPDRVANDVAKIPLRRMAKTTEIARAVAFLASDESSYITGIDLLVDGGLNLS